MATPTDENRDLLTVVAYLRAKAGKEQELRTALETLIEPTLAEDGCLSYNLHQGVEDPTFFVFYENWTGAAALEAHLQSPHIQKLVPRLPDLLDGELTINRVRRIA